MKLPVMLHSDVVLTVLRVEVHGFAHAAQKLISQIYQWVCGCLSLCVMPFTLPLSVMSCVSDSDNAQWEIDAWSFSGWYWWSLLSCGSHAVLMSNSGLAPSRVENEEQLLNQIKMPGTLSEAPFPALDDVPYKSKELTPSPAVLALAPTAACN